MLTDSIEEVLRQAAEYSAYPLWTATDRTPPSPIPRAIPHVWPYAPLRELLLRASNLISAEEARRRVFRLTNPGTNGSLTTDTLFAGLQCILQGERAPAHRHTPFALRFVIEGDGAFTSVDGERLWMEPGDLILTPSWTYHDHQKDGPGALIWLDGLDVPLFQFLRIGFQENWSPARSTLVDAQPDSSLRFPWSEMRTRLLAEPGPYAVLPYLHRLTGAPIGRTIGARAERLDRGLVTPRRRHTASHILNVIAGHGRSRVGEHVLEWGPGDTIAIPAWQVHSHENAGDQTAYLFAYSDRPMLENLGLYREDASGE
jgi:gentisate 1,2-dioxygenase